MRNGIKRAASAIAIAVALYSLLGFLILPGIGLRIANQQLAHYSQVPASLHRLQVNPFTLEVSLWRLHIGQPDQAQIAFERLYADLQLDSLWTGAVHLATIELDKPHSEITFSQQGQLNLTQLFAIPPSPEPTDHAPRGEPFPLRIDSITLNAGNLLFQDQRPSTPIEVIYDDLNLELTNLSTLADNTADMRLTASGPSGARIDWQGDLSLSPIRSRGSLQVTDAKLSAFWPYVRDALPLVLESGTVNLSSDYTLDLATGTELLLSNSQLTLRSFAIKSPTDQPLLRLASLDISDTRIDLAKQQVVVGKLRSQQLETWAAREADGQLDWQKLLANQPAATSARQAAAPESVSSEAPTGPAEPPPAEPAAANTRKPAPNSAPGKPWQVILRDVQLRDYQLHLADRAAGPAVTLDLAPLNLDLSNFDSHGTSPFTLALETGVNQTGMLKADGQVQLSPTTATLQVVTRDIDLRMAQAYLSPFVQLELRSGKLGSDLTLALQSVTPLAFSVVGQAEINQLHTLDTIKGRDFVKWQQVQVEGLDYQHGKGLTIAQVNLQQPYARFIINEDLTTNINDLLIPQPASSTPAGTPLPIRIGGIRIKDGSTNFADFSLRPNFATAIGQLNGQIGTLDNQRAQPASVDIQGKVDKYAPVSIKGQLTPFDPLNSLDIITSFSNVELTTLTPYSGKFAGFRIRKGRLNLDLHYQIEKGQLNAENKLLLEDLQLGEKVDSEDAMDLPIRLAVALLKDSQGNIAIQLPVQGNLNNPEFSVMPIVWQTLRNLVLRAAQAPFKFIGGLVSGTANIDLSTVHFNAGDSQLDAPAQSALDLLANALKQRPTLRLEIEGKTAKSTDGPLLAAERLQREYQNTWYKVLQRRGDKVPNDPSELDVSEDDQQVLLEGIYRARLKQQPPAEWAALEDAERSAKMRESVLQFWAKSELLQRRLAQARAAEIKNYLVERGGLSAERIYLLDVDMTEANAEGRVASTLHLGSE